MCADLIGNPTTEDPIKALYTTARRHISTLTPENAVKVIGHERYWTRQFLELFFERCEHSKFERPVESMAEAKHLVDLVSLIRIGNGPGELWSEDERMSWKVRALALEGEIAGLAGCRAYMKTAMERAVVLAESGRVLVVTAAELLRRQAVIAMREGDVDEAVRRIGASEAVYRSLDPGMGLGEALIVFGLVKNPAADGLIAASEALSLASPLKDDYAGRLFDAGLSMWIERAASPKATVAHCQAILQWSYGARQKWFKRHPYSWRKLGLVWAEALAVSRLGLGRLAQKRLSTVCRRLSDLELWEPLTVASLDLACELVGEDERRLAVKVLSTSRDLLPEESELKEVLAKAEPMSFVGLGDLRRETVARWLPNVGSFFPLRHPNSPLVGGENQDFEEPR